MKKLVVLSPFIFSFISASSIACSCVEDVEINWDTDTIVTAVVVAEPWTFSFTRKKYVFEVTESLLNFSESTLNVMTPRETTACGYNYEMGAKYLIIANNIDDQFYSGRCSSWPIESELAKKVLNKINAKP